MSSLESFIWHLLGYIAMPTIFIVGFLASVVTFYYLVKLFNKEGVEE
ncbi:MAG: TIGR02808 family protein [Motiliproteus sp.]